MRKCITSAFLTCCLWTYLF